MDKANIEALKRLEVYYKEVIENGKPIRLSEMECPLCQVNPDCSTCAWVEKTGSICEVYKLKDILAASLCTRLDSIFISKTKCPKNTLESVEYRIKQIGEWLDEES